MSFNPQTDFKAFSKGGYASFYYLSEWKSLFDCGDGVVARLGSRVGGLKYLFLTHGHLDHLGALPAILWAREVGLGENNRPLPIYFPRGDWRIESAREWIEKLGMSGGAEWHELDANQSVSLGKRRIETFPTEHIEGALTIGFKLFESRTTLKPEFADLPQNEIVARNRAGTFGEISQTIENCEIAFCGDSTPVDAQNLQGAAVIFHEATALSEKDLGSKNHSTLSGALQVGQNARAQKMVLGHFSTRYSRAQVAFEVGKMARDLELDFEVWCVFGSEIWRAHAPATRG